MRAYANETGNTENRTFDPAPPVFITAALLTSANFDLVWAMEIADLRVT